MKKILFLSPVFFMVILSVLVLAAGSLSISSVTIPSSATVGDSFTITVSISGTQIQSDQATGTLTLPSEISCTPSGSQTISLSGDTGSTSWSCSANAAGDYTSQITASVTGTDSGTLATLADSWQTGLNVLSPASLAVSSAISSSTITTSGSMTLTIGVNNAGGQSTNYNISLSSSPSGLSFSPSSVSTNSIDGSTLENNAITVSGSTAVSYTITATVMSNDQTLTTSQLLTVSGTQQTPGNPSGGSSGGTMGGGSSTKVTVAKGNANITIPSIAAGKTSSVSISKYEDIAIRQINVSVANTANNIKITITKIAGLPASVTHEITGKIYHYIQISKENITDTNVNKVFIKFAVGKSWLTTNNVDKSNIALYRWSGSRWDELTATYLSEDLSEVFYKVESPGLSVFAIGAKGGISSQAPTGAATACTESWSCSDWSTCSNNVHTRTCTDSNNCGTTTNKPAESESCEVGQASVTTPILAPWMIYSVVALIIVVIMVAIFIFKDKLFPKKKAE